MRGMLKSRQQPKGSNPMTEKETSRTQAARRIAALLANAEDAAKKGNESLRDTYLEKAAALQLKFAIEDAMLPTGTEGRDEIVHEDFCQESNTPLIKAKRELINGLAKMNRGSAVMMSDLKRDAEGNPRFKNGKPLWNKRAFVRVYAHRSDLDFIRAMYTSLILQMQTMMAADESQERGGISAVQAWRVSYAYAWVRRVYQRLNEARLRNERETTSATPGTALVLRDRTQAVEAYVNGRHNLKKTSYRRDDKDEAGRQAGYAAGSRADLGGTKIGKDTREIKA